MFVRKNSKNAKFYIKNARSSIINMPVSPISSMKTKINHEKIDLKYFSTIQQSQENKKIVPFSNYKEEFSMKTDKNYIEVKEVMDELLFFVEISFESISESHKIGNFLCEYKKKFKEKLIKLEENPENSTNKEELLEDNDILPLDLIEKQYFQEKYVQRISGLKAKLIEFQKENYTEIQDFSQNIGNTIMGCTKQKLELKGFCCSHAKELKQKMYKIIIF